MRTQTAVLIMCTGIIALQAAALGQSNLTHYWFALVIAESVFCFVLGQLHEGYRDEAEGDEQ